MQLFVINDLKWPDIKVLVQIIIINYIFLKVN